MRAISKIVDKIFPEFRASKHIKVRDMHRQGEAAVPGPKAEDVLQRLQEGGVTPDVPVEQVPTTLTPDTPESAGLPNAEDLPVTGPASPMRQDLGAPSPEEVLAETAEPLERRTRARNINLDYFAGANNVEDIGRALEANAKLMDHGDEAVKSLAETRANVEGKSEDIFKQVLTEAPAALSDEQLLAGRDVLLTLVSEQQRLAAMIAKNQATQEDIVTFDLVSDQAAMVQDYMQGKIRQAARALNSMKVVAQTIRTADPARIAEAAKGSHIIHRAQAVLDMKANGATDGEIIKVAGEMSAAKQFGTAVVNLRSGSLLTGVKTQMVNGINNAFHGAYRALVVKPIAAGVGYVRTGGEFGAERVYAKEAAADMVGLLHGIGEALNIAKSTLYHGTVTNKGEYISMYGGRKIDEIAEGAGHVGTAGRELIETIPFAGKVLGKVAGMGPEQVLNVYHRGVETISFGMLTASDDAFKTVAYRATMNSLALRETEKLGLKGEAAGEHILKILSDVSHEFHQKAMREAEIRTFTNREDIAPFLNHWANAIVKAGNMVPIVRWFMPFTRTPTAILDRSLRSTPMAMKWHADVRQKIEAGGVEGDMALAEIIAGTSITTMIGSMVAMGLITGNGPARRDDPSGSIRRGMIATGWQPNSYMSSSGKLTSLKRGFDPVMLVPLAIAQSVEAAQYAKDEASVYDYTIGAVATIGTQFAEASFMTGMQELLSMVLEGTPASYPGRAAASFIPRLSRDIDAIFRYGMDIEGRPYVPRTDNVGVALSMHLQAALPFVDHPNVHRYWDGSVVTAGGGDMMFMMNTFTPIRSSWLYNSEGRAADPATASLNEARVPVSRVSAKVVVDSKTGATIDLLELPNGAYLLEELRIMVGKNRRMAVEATVRTAAYEKARKDGLAGPRSEYAMQLGEAVRQGRTAGTQKFLAKINSSSFSMKKYGGEDTRDLLSGKAAGKLLQKKAHGVANEADVDKMRDMGLRGIPTRGQIAPAEGSGSKVKVQFDQTLDKNTYVPNL